MTVHLGYYRAYLRCQAPHALGNHKYFKISCQRFHQKHLKSLLYNSLLYLAFNLYRHVIRYTCCFFLWSCIWDIRNFMIRRGSITILSYLFSSFFFCVGSERKKRREGQDCSQAWWRGKFIVDNRESIARGRDWGTWDSPQWQTELAQWREEEGKEEWEPGSAVRKR